MTRKTTDRIYVGITVGVLLGAFAYIIFALPTEKHEEEPAQYAQEQLEGVDGLHVLIEDALELTESRRIEIPTDITIDFLMGEPSYIQAGGITSYDEWLPIRVDKYGYVICSNRRPRSRQFSSLLSS